MKQKALNILSSMKEEIVQEAFITKGDCEALHEKADALEMAIAALKRDEIAVDTLAGELRAGLNSSPDFPGLYLYFIPKGAAFEVDLALAEVPLDCDGGINLYVYGNLFSEEWTKKHEFKPETIKTMVKWVNG